MSDVLKLRDLVYEETGMFFPDEKQYYFESRFKKRVDALGLKGWMDYYKFLKTDKDRREELNRLMSELTINETSFFRNMPQFTALQNLVIPEILKEKKDKAVKMIKIWSAGCSSGEEVYTIAMLFEEMKNGPLAGYRLEVTGTDISPRVLEKAQKGIYSDYPVRNMPDYFKQKYFEKVPEGYKIKDVLRPYVKFKHLNLNNDMEMVFMKGFDVIFCRNVLIYFDMDSKKRVLQHFFNDLIVGGYLFIGFSESLFGVDDRFKLIHFPGGMVYRKAVHI